jgi:hypothetical protein
VAFLSSLGSEFAARRVRLREAFGDRGSSVAEFLFIGGISLGLFAAVFGEWRGLAPLLALISGYVLLDVTRQRALSAGADETQTRKRQDRLVFALFAAMAVMGAAIFFFQQQEASRRLDPPSPGEQFEVDILAPS